MRLKLLLFLSLAWPLMIEDCWGQAFCELRDPTQSIHELFPGSSNYQSVVRTIDKSSRSQINAIIPLKSGLHFNELGQHTLYVVYKKKVPLGFVHVRSEQSQWGLIEVAWAVSLDLKILDFRFQRCRNPKKRALEAAKNRAFIQDKSLKQLRSMLSKDEKRLENTKNIVPGSEQLSMAMIRCGIKTLVATAIVWRKVIQGSIVRRRVFTLYPTKAQSFSAVPVTLTEAVEKELTALGLTGKTTGIVRDNILAYRIKDAKGVIIGVLMRAKWQLPGVSETLWCLINKRGAIEKIECRSPKHQVILDKLVGQTRKDLRKCKTAIKLAGLELLIIGGALF